MNKQTYLNKIIQLAFETGRGNRNAFKDVFGEGHKIVSKDDFEMQDEYNLKQ